MTLSLSSRAAICANTIAPSCIVLARRIRKSLLDRRDDGARVGVELDLRRGDLLCGLCVRDSPPLCERGVGIDGLVHLRLAKAHAERVAQREARFLGVLPIDGGPQRAGVAWFIVNPDAGKICAAAVTADDELVVAAPPADQDRRSPMLRSDNE
jgi:hypothetical protein